MYLYKAGLVLIVSIICFHGQTMCILMKREVYCVFPLGPKFFNSPLSPEIQNAASIVSFTSKLKAFLLTQT